jgi:uncharacterized protein
LNWSTVPELIRKSRVLPWSRNGCWIDAPGCGRHRGGILVLEDKPNGAMDVFRAWYLERQTSAGAGDEMDAPCSGRLVEVLMTTMKEAAAEFLSEKRIAVAGVSREAGGAHGGNPVYKRLRERGYDVYVVNPNAEDVEGDVCYPRLGAIPGGVDAVVIATRPDVADDVMGDCVELGIKHVWMHRGPGAGSVSQTAAELGRKKGITVIDGGCPLMYAPTADTGHKVLRGVLSLVGRMPKTV